MKKLKGIKPIDKYLNKWLKDHHFDCTVQIGTDFGYDCVNDIITYALVVPDMQDKHFIDVCKECRPEIEEADNFLLSFFHELGHFETQGIFEEKEWEQYDKLCKKLHSKQSTTLEDCNKYWHHPIELEATQWACDYIIDNREEVAKWWKDVQSLIMNFMKLNNVEID